MIDEKQARQQLPRTWHAFFARFGRLRDSQRVAIGPIIAGHSVLLSSPTASGKTEAIIAPLLERVLKQIASFRKKTPQLKLLIICPTRALCNDMLRRIRGPVSQCGVTTKVKSGDHSHFNKKKPPTVLITTPESLDSLLTRSPKALTHLSGIMLDELHLLADSARGDQLQVLVHRVRRMNPSIQVAGASATVANMERLAVEFVGEDARILHANYKFNRSIKAEYFQAITLEEAALVFEAVREKFPHEKVLVFANKRKEIEKLSVLLRAQKARIHHGSLSQSERLRTETILQRESSGIYIATSTLEVGIDIQDIDRIVLISPPANVASYLQRVGRGDRRSSTVHVTCLYANNFEKYRYEHLLLCAEKSNLFDEAVPFRPNVLAQQAMSILYQNPKKWISANTLHKRLPSHVAEQWSKESCELILNSLQEKDYLLRDTKGRYTANSKLQELHKFGFLHSMISDSKETSVIDNVTGRAIGSVNFGKNIPQNFLLAGRNLEITGARNGAFYVKSTKTSGDPTFLTREAPKYSFSLAQNFAENLGYEKNKIIVNVLDEHIVIEHFLGTVWGRMLAGVFRLLLRAKTKKVTPFSFIVTEISSIPTSLGSAKKLSPIVQKVLENNQKSLANTLGPGAFAKEIPQEILGIWVFKAVKLQAFCALLEKTIFVSKNPATAST